MQDLRDSGCARKRILWGIELVATVSSSSRRSSKACAAYNSPCHHACPDLCRHWSDSCACQLVWWRSDNTCGVAHYCGASHQPAHHPLLRRLTCRVLCCLQGLEKLKVPLHLQVSSVSPKALQLVEAAGGSVERVYYTRLGLKALLKVTAQAVRLALM